MDGNSSDDFGLTFWWGPGHAVITDQEARDLGESVTVGQGGGIEMGRGDLGDSRKKEEAVFGSTEETFKGR